MPVPLYHVNAFTKRPFQGNSAAVCPLVEWLDDRTLQAVAAECNLSETAFFVPEGDGYRLRWFTPQCEVKLCGHATLASGFVLLTLLEPRRESVAFETLSGRLLVRREGDLLSMDFPALPPWHCSDPPAALIEGLSAHSQRGSVFQISDNFFVVYETKEEIDEVRPNLALLEKLHPFGVAITAPGRSSDFVSRYFAPSYGVPEDPVTGSTHCSLCPYWAARLGKMRLHARQVSKRGGELWCEYSGSRVFIQGSAVLTLRGELLLP